MNPVTDPEILAQLNGGGPAAAVGPKAVTDPSILAQLNGQPGVHNTNAPRIGLTMRSLQGDIDTLKAGGLPENDPEILAKQAILANPGGVADPARDLERGAGGVLRGLQNIPDSILQMIAPSTRPQLEAERIGYDAKRSALGGEGFDTGEAIGQAVGTAPLLGPIGPGAGLIGGALRGGLSGALGGMMQPVYGEGNFTAKKVKQAETGALGGAAIGGASNLLAGILRPNTSAAVQALRQEGVPTTPGQTMGGAAQRIEEGLESTPILGDAIKAAKQRNLESYNLAAGNKTLANIGQRLEPDTPAGHAAIKEAGQKISDAYKALVPTLSAKADPQFVSDLSRAFSTSSLLPQERRQQFAKIIADKLANKVDPKTGAITGAALQEAQSELGRLATTYRTSTDADQRLMGRTLGEVQNSLLDLLERSNPASADALRGLKRAYSMQLRLEDASGKAGTAIREGVFTPAQLDSAVRSLDPSMRGRAYARGDALLQDYAQAGQQAMGSRVPDSGTPFRMMLNMNPLWWGGASVASKLYSPRGQHAITSLLADRPEFAGPLAEAIRRGGSLGAMGGSKLPVGLLGGP